ncbi:MAG: zinc-ribbon domain-containing protein [Methylovirgula sp.]|nr:zinc-ribbon domain-containing protein [Methylovirgula sp.]
MLIDCPSCGASYHITKATLEPNGRRVACPRCETVWLAKPSMPEAEAEVPAPFTADVRISADDRLAAGMAHKSFARTVSAPAPPAPRPHIPAFVHNFFAGTLLLALAMGLIASRGAVARAWPGAGRLYAAIGIPVDHDGLAIRDLHTSLTRMNGELFLGVEGEIVNLRPDSTPVPAVRLAIRDAGGHELYTWTVRAERRTLAAGDSLLFRARLAQPPAGGRDVAARFAAADMLASR